MRNGDIRVFPRIHNPGIDRGNSLASHIGRFTSGERAPDTCWIWGWMCRRPRLDIASAGNRNLCRPTRTLVTDWDIQPARYLFSFRINSEWNAPWDLFVIHDAQEMLFTEFAFSNLNLFSLVWFWCVNRGSGNGFPWQGRWSWSVDQPGGNSIVT
jgi:hypothetical protein